jgi:hypothetical protein
MITSTVPIAVMVPIMVMVVVVAMSVFPRPVIATPMMFFDGAPGRHQETGQTEQAE